MAAGATGGGGKLASQYVEFTARGLDTLQAGMDMVKSNLGKIENAGKSMGSNLNSAFSGMAAKVASTKADLASMANTAASAATALQSSMQRATQGMQGSFVNPIAIGAAVAAFQMLTNATRAWVSAGLSGTGQGNMLAMQFTLLSQQIAGVFVPTINLVTNAIERLTGWFRSLDGTQQSTIRRWVEAAAVMVLVAGVAGKLGAAMVGMFASMSMSVIGFAATITSTIIPLIGEMVTAIVTGSGIAGAALNLAFAGIPIILGAIGAVLSALASLGVAGVTLGAGIAVGTESGRSALTQLLGTLRNVIAAISTAGSALWARIGPVLEMLGGKLGEMFSRAGAALLAFVERSGPLFDKIGALAATIGDRVGKMLDGLDGEILVQILDISVRLLGAFLQIVDAAMKFGEAFDRSVGKFSALVSSTDILLGHWTSLLFIIEKAADGMTILADAAERMSRSPWFRFMAFGAIGFNGGREDDRPKTIQQNTTRDRTDVTGIGGQMEQAMDLFKRIQEAAIKTQVARQIELAEQTLAAIEQVATNTQEREKTPVVAAPGVVERTYDAGQGVGNGMFAGLRAMFGGAD